MISFDTDRVCVQCIAGNHFCWTLTVTVSISQQGVFLLDIDSDCTLCIVGKGFVGH